MLKDEFIESMIAKGKVTQEKANIAKAKEELKRKALEKAKGDLNKLTKAELIDVVTG